MYPDHVTVTQVLEFLEECEGQTVEINAGSTDLGSDNSFMEGLMCVGDLEKVRMEDQPEILVRNTYVLNCPAGRFGWVTVPDEGAAVRLDERTVVLHKGTFALRIRRKE